MKHAGMRGRILGSDYLSILSEKEHLKTLMLFRFSMQNNNSAGWSSAPAAWGEEFENG
jgi:hypothetical protein